MKIYWNRIFKAEAMGIKCDECFWQKSEETDIGSWLNKPCPNCGANVLTDEDWKFAQFIIKIDKWLGWIKYPSFKKQETKKMTKVMGRWRIEDQDGDITWLRK